MNPRLVGAVVAPFLVVLSLGVWALTQPSSVPPPAPVLDNGHRTIIGPNGPVILHDWRDGRRWLSWYTANQKWSGPPLWTDRAWHEYASCAAFARTLICLNLDPQARGTSWEILGMRLGTMAMLRSGLQPDQSSHPAPIVSTYLTQLRREGVDVYRLFGLPQSPALQDGSTMLQYYERALFRWRSGSRDPSTMSQAPLGQMASDQGW